MRTKKKYKFKCNSCDTEFLSLPPRCHWCGSFDLRMVRCGKKPHRLTKRNVMKMRDLRLSEYETVPEYKEYLKRKRKVKIK